LDSFLGSSWESLLDFLWESSLESFFKFFESEDLLSDSWLELERDLLEEEASLFGFSDFSSLDWRGENERFDSLDFSW
jgi:hypothetical protein